MEAAAAAASLDAAASVAAPAATLATQAAADTIVQAAVADAATSAASVVAASSSVSVAADSVARAAELSCPNWAPLARAVQCPAGTEALWMPSLGVPAWVLLSHSAQGTLGLFSLKHLLLHQMPTIKTWLAKLRAVANEGRLHAAGSAGSHNASNSARASSNAADDRPVGLPALLSAPAREDSRPSHASASSSSSVSSPASSSSSASSIAAAPAPPSPHAAHLAMLHQLYESSASDQLASLGTNVHESVLSFFSARELAELMLVSKSWYRAANADHLWSALNEREIMKQFLSPESGLYEVIQGMESDSNAAELSASSSASSSSSSHSDVAVLPPRRRSIPWDSIIRSQQHSICHIVVHIATAWHAHMFAAQSNSSDFEADLLSEVHQLTQAIAKLNTFLGYIKAAEKHARQVVQRKSMAGAAASSDTTAAPALMSRYESTSALLLTACALVQACHRFCSGVTPAKPRPRISRQSSSAAASSSSSSSSSSSTASMSPSLAASASAVPAAASMESIHDELTSQQDASTSMARDSDLLSQVIEEQEGIRRRRTAAASQSDDALPPPVSSPALASASSYAGPASSSSSSSSSSSATPALQRSMSTPAPVCAPAARNSLLHLLPERRWQSIGDILLLMEQSGLMHFDFSVAEVIRLNAAAHTPAAQADPAGTAAASSPSAVAASAAPAVAAAPASNDPDDPNDSDDSEFGDDDDSEGDEDDSGEDSEEDDSDGELPPAPAPAQPAAPGAPAAAAAPALPPAHQPAARARHQRRWILAADIDEQDNIFLTAIPIDASPKTQTPAAEAAGAAMPTSSSVAAPVAAVESTEATATSVASSASATSSSSADSATEFKENDGAAASSSSSSSSSVVPSDHELRQRALALAVDELANDASRPPAKARRQPASAKAAYKESLHFLRVQQGLDESKRDERKLVRSQQQTARLHDLLRHAFKLLIFLSMMWSSRDSGLLHLLFRFGAWVCLLWSALSWYGIDLELDLDDGANMQMHNHAHQHGPGFAQMQMQAHGQQPEEPPLPPAPLLPAPLMQPFNLALDFFGLMAVGPAAQEQMGAMPNQIAHPPLLADHADPAVLAADVAALQQRKRLRRVLLCLCCVIAVETFNYVFGHGNPEWFVQLMLTLLRFTPLSFGITTLIVMAVSGLTWRNRGLQAILLASVMLECAFWTFEFRSRSMELFGLFLWKSVAPRMWKIAVAAARLAPISSVLVALGSMVASMAMLIVPVMMDAILEPGAPAAPAGAANNLLAAHGMPVLNLNPAAQNWTLLFNIMRFNPELRRSYKLFGITCVAAAIAEGIYSLAGFDLPWVVDVWTKMRAAAPVLASVAYDLTVTEGRGLILGLALLRFVWVVDQSLPIATLSILAGGRRAKKPAAAATPALRRQESAAAAGATPLSSPSLSRQVSDAGAADSSSSSSLSGSAAPVRSPSLGPATPLVVCLSCARHSCPFTLVRWLQDFLFESSLLCSWPLSGVQAMHVQKHEQYMQITDTAQTILAARQELRRERENHEGAAALSVFAEEDDADLPLQIKTCNSCLLHSIRAQLALPFVYLLCLYLIFSVVLPPPSYSSYRELLFAGAHYLLDRVPCVALFDVVQGWWSGRVLQCKRAYLALTTAVLAYASYVVWFAWFHQIGAWFLLPGFLYQPMFNGASWLILDAAWLAVWTIN